MPSIEPRRNTKGKITSYRLTVSTGTNYMGKPIRHRTIWMPPQKNMTESQMKKAATAAAYKFEELIRSGFMIDNDWNFAGYAQHALELKERAGVRPATVDRYIEMLPRINHAIGHLKLTQIRPQHLNDFYEDLTKRSKRQNCTRAVAKEALLQKIAELKLSKATLSRRAHIAASTITVVTRGDPVQLSTAQAISQALECELSDLFTIKEQTFSLSSKTILEHHRLISSILAQAEKEMLITYNPAAKATPPRVEKTAPNYYQPEEMDRILDTLDAEAPLRWKTITYLLIDTGCRRGEIMGLKWNNVDLSEGLITIDCALLYTKSKGIYEGPTKTRDIRALKLSPQCLDILKQWYNHYTDLAKHNESHFSKTSYVFARDDGSPMHPDSITDWLNKFSRKHNLPHIHPHAFRHTAASTMIANGMDLITTAAELGHRSPTTTATIYAHEFAIARAKAAKLRAGVFYNRQQKTLSCAESK